MADISPHTQTSLASIPAGHTSYEEFHRDIRSRYDALPRRLKQVADFIMKQPDDVALGTVSELAKGADVQPSAVIRFAQTFGFEGFTELQLIFQQHLRNRGKPYKQRVTALQSIHGKQDKTLTVLNQFYYAALESLHALHQHIDTNRLEKAIKCLSKGRCIYILGLRRSMPVARYLSYLFLKLEIHHCILGLETGLEEEAMLMAGSRDAAIVISFTDYAVRTVEIFKALEKKKVPIVSITDSPASPVIPESGLWLEVIEANYQGFRSNAATMTLIMTLATMIAEKRNDRKGETLSISE